MSEKTENFIISIIQIILIIVFVKIIFKVIGTIYKLIFKNK